MWKGRAYAERRPLAQVDRLAESAPQIDVCYSELGIRSNISEIVSPSYVRGLAVTTIAASILILVFQVIIILKMKFRRRRLEDEEFGKHKHSAIKFVGPAQRHRSEDINKLTERDEVYRQTKAANPSRWSGATRNWERPESMILNPDKPEEKLKKAA